MCVRRNVNFRPPSFFFSLFAFVRPLDRRIELGQIKENDSRGVTTLLSVTNTSVLFLRVRPYRSGRMNGPGQFRLKQAGEKKKPRVSRFCLQKIFLPFDYDGNWVQGRAKRKWAAPSRPCIPAVKRDASAVPYAVPREKKRSRGTRPLSPPRSLRLPTRNRKTLIGWSSVRLPVLALPPSLSPPTPSYLHYYTYSILPQQRKRPSLLLVLFLSLHPQQPVWCVRFHSSLPPTSSIYLNTNSASHS